MVLVGPVRPQTADRRPLSGYDRIAFRGVMADRAFAAFYYKGDKLIAVDAVNRPAEYLGAKMLIQTNRTLPPSVIEDMSRQ